MKAGFSKDAKNAARYTGPTHFSRFTIFGWPVQDNVEVIGVHEIASVIGRAPHTLLRSPSKP